MNIAILGAGGWGMALACALSKKNDIYLWSHSKEEIERLRKTRQNEKLLLGITLPENVICEESLKKAVEKSDIVLFVVPSFAIRETAKKVAPFFNKRKIAVCASKGLEDGTFLTLCEVISDELPPLSRVCALSWPTHAEEVSRGIPTAIVVASNDTKAAETVQKAFISDSFRVYVSNDPKGVEVGAAIKNVIALCAGISDGCGYGDNSKAALMTRGIHEISKLGCAMGGKRETFMGLSGIGDLIVTCTSVHSRNRRCGILIGKGLSSEKAVEEVGMVVEGIKCLKAVYHASQRYEVDMPIVKEAYSVIYENKDPKESVSELMTRGMKYELD